MLGECLSSPCSTKGSRGPPVSRKYEAQSLASHCLAHRSRTSQAGPRLSCRYVDLVVPRCHKTVIHVNVPRASSTIKIYCAGKVLQLMASRHISACGKIASRLTEQFAGSTEIRTDEVVEEPEPELKVRGQCNALRVSVCMGFLFSTAKNVTNRRRMPSWHLRTPSRLLCG